MTHLLDNAAWHALIGPQRSFGRIGTLCARYRSEISPIAALAEESDAAFADLAALCEPGEIVAISCEREFPTRNWQALMNVPLSQWVQSGVTAAEASDDIATLGAADQEDMFSLARLADPGP